MNIDRPDIENIGLQTVCNNINNISKGNNTKDTSNTDLKRNNEEKKLKKKDEIVRSGDIQGYQGDKSIEEIIIGDEKFIGNKSSEQNQSFKNFATIEQTLDVSSLKSQNTDSADFVLITNNKSRKKQKSENTLNETTNNFPPQDSYLLSQNTQPKSVKKKKKKLKSSMTHSNQAEDSVQSLHGSSALSQRASPVAIPTTLPKPVEYNYKEVILFVKQAWQDVEKEKINGRLNILEYKRE